MKRKIVFGTIGALFLALGVQPALWAAVVSGKVAYGGEPVTQKPIVFGAEKQCALMHEHGTPLSEDVVVNQNGTLRHVLVYIKEEVPGAQVPATPVEIDQKGCIFAPHVAAAQAGQMVVFKNNDSLLHNVRTVSKVNKPFNIAQPVQGMTTNKKFDSPELGIQLRCDVHFWMSSYLHVLPHAYFAVTGEDGSFSIQGLPAGTYTLETWHEKLGPQSQTITVGEGETKSIDFTVQ